MLFIELLSERWRPSAPGKPDKSAPHLTWFMWPPLAGCLLTLAASAAAQEPQPEPAPAPQVPLASDTAATPEAGATTPDVSERERQKLEAEFQRALGGAQEPAASSASVPTAANPLHLIDVALDLLGVGGTSSAAERELRQLEAGGHDPKNRGFTVQNVELTFSGVVDPYLRGDSNIVLTIDEAGETVIELEEAYLTTLDLPFNLQLKAGQFFNAFGRLNPIHPHAWDFVDQPVVNSRFFGPDGLRGPGVQLSWLTPLPFFAELTGSVQNAQGETSTSFRGVAGDTLAGRTLIERPVQSATDLLYLARLKTSFDPTEDITLVSGLSALWGPNASGARTHTQIYGADLYVKWKPLDNEQGWPFLAWQTEAMYRSYQAGAVAPVDLVVANQRRLADVGMYCQLLWGFARPWVVGIRYDRALGQAESFSTDDLSYATESDSLRDERQRYAAVVSYYPSEFSKLRLQYEYDRAQFLKEGDAHSAYLQFEILFGAHGAHKF